MTQIVIGVGLIAALFAIAFCFRRRAAQRLSADDFDDRLGADARRRTSAPVDSFDYSVVSSAPQGRTTTTLEVAHVEAVDMVDHASKSDHAVAHGDQRPPDSIVKDARHDDSWDDDDIDFVETQAGVHARWRSALPSIDEIDVDTAEASISFEKQRVSTTGDHDDVSVPIKIGGVPFEDHQDGEPTRPEQRPELTDGPADDADSTGRTAGRAYRYSQADLFGDEYPVEEQHEEDGSRETGAAKNDLPAPGVSAESSTRNVAPDMRPTEDHDDWSDTQINEDLDEFFLETDPYDGLFDPEDVLFDVLAGDPASTTEGPAIPTFRVDVDRGGESVTRYDKANRLVASTLRRLELDHDDYRGVLEEIFLESPRPRTQQSVEALIAGGTDARGLALATEIRRLWRARPEFAQAASFHAPGAQPWQFSELALSQLSWPRAARIGELWTHEPDMDEVERLLDTLYERWHNSATAQRAFATFPLYLGYAVGDVRGSLSIWPEFSFEVDDWLEDPFVAFEDNGCWGIWQEDLRTAGIERPISRKCGPYDVSVPKSE